MESEENRRLKENSVVENLAVTWEKSLGGVKRVAVFSARPFNDMDSDTTPTPGDELVLKLDEDSAKVENIKSIKNEDGTVGYGWSGKGKVSRVDDEEEMVYLEMSTNKDVPFKVTETYSVEFVWKSTTYDRMQHAMKTFAVDDTSVSGYLYHILLGHDVPKQLIKASPPADLRVPNMPALNPPQELAVRSALCEPLSLIQGPPGTGKTLLALTEAPHYNILQWAKKTYLSQDLGPIKKMIHTGYSYRTSWGMVYIAIPYGIRMCTWYAVRVR